MLDRNSMLRLKQALRRSPSVALLGVRQIGKTTLAKQLAKQQSSIYLDLEAAADLAKISDPAAFFKENSKKLIILDEIQRAPDLFVPLRGVIDGNRQRGKKSKQFLLLGSASVDLLKQSSESLAGRIEYLEMSGLNVLEANKKPISQLWLRGGFPDSYLAKNNNDAMMWLDNFIRTYLERDIPQMGFKIPATRLKRLWTMLAHSQGETISATKLANNLQVDAKTINSYIDILCNLFLLRRLNPYHSNVKKRLVKSPRYYVRDSGVLHRLLGIGDYNALLSNPVLGKSWEGFVIENIHSVLPQLCETYFYRTQAGAEIDLIIKMPNGDVWAVEIKYGTAPKLSKHFNQSCKDVGATHRFVIYGGDEEFPMGKDTRAIPLEKFLKKLKGVKS